MTQGDLPLVLAVDDEQHNLTLLQRVLKKSYKVICVSSGQTALDTLLQAPFDLVLLDIMMPDMDGLHALEFIRKNPKTASVPVILISALSDGASVARGLEAGANDYITKPIDMDVTLARVQTQIALKKLQDEREHTISELKTAQEMKDRLLQMASHDLKGPLMNIRMAATLMEGSAGGNENEGLLQAMQSSVDTMQNVINDFLDTAALQTGVLDLHLESIPLEPLIKDIMVEHMVNAQRKNIMLDIGEVVGSVQGDRARFHQALGNLISNAIKYSPRDTTVRISTEFDDSAVTVYVADEGPGIPLAEQDMLFTQFGKLSPRPTGGESSTGLGLWIVKHLVTLQKGQVGLTSPADGGSIFWIQMPVGKTEGEKQQ